MSTSQLINPLTNKSFQQKSIKDIKTYAGSPRMHAAEQIEALAESIKAFGFVSPIIINRDGVLLAGHARLEAAKLLGLKTVPVVILEHLSPIEEKAYRLADNRLSENSTWDDALLKNELTCVISELIKGEIDFGITTLGWNDAEFDLLMHSDSSDHKEAEVSDVETLLQNIGEPRAKLGETWIAGRHKIHCGSSLELSSFEKLMNGEQAALVCTDPPFNVSINGHVSRKGHREFAQAVGEMSFKEFQDFLATFMGHALRMLKDGALFYVFMDWRHDRELQAAAALWNLLQINLVVWNKGTGGMGSMYRSQHELIYVYRQGKKQHKNNVMLGKWGRNRTNVWDYPSANMSKEGREALKGHPTPKPIEMIAELIKDCTSVNDIVLDPFLGSGTALLAAEKTNRRCYAIELDPLYVDLAINRWEAMTGQKAHLENSATIQPKKKRIRHR